MKLLAICGLQYFPLIWRFVAAKWLSSFSLLSAVYGLPSLPCCSLSLCPPHFALSWFYVWQFAGIFMICSIVSAAFGVANRCIFNATLKSHLHWAPTLFMLFRFSAFPPLRLLSVCAESENSHFFPHSFTCGHSICPICNQSQAKFKSFSDFSPKNSWGKNLCICFSCIKETHFVCVCVCALLLNLHWIMRERKVSKIIFNRVNWDNGLE